MMQQVFFLVLFRFVENSSAYSFKGNGLVDIEIAPTYMSSGLTDLVECTLT